MPRRRGGAAPSRPMAAPSRSAAPPPQKRSASTAAYPGAASGQQLQKSPAQAQQASKSPGMLGQIASTAAGVAIGSTIGHALGGMFGGGSTAAAEDTQSNAATNYDAGAGYASQGYQAQQGTCTQQVATFRECMDKNQSDLNICGWYLDQLKACQQAASKY